VMEQISKRLMNWASILEDNTREQAVTTSGMPFIYPHLALMPDAHLGKGATVGSVIPTVGAIIPAAVGVDIGCGMMAVRTQFTWTTSTGSDRGSRCTPRSAAAIPLSAGKYNQTLTETAGARSRSWKLAPVRVRPGGGRRPELADAARLARLRQPLHRGVLDEEDRVWLFLHSGSRGVGNKLATKHIKVAQEQCAKRFIDLPDRDLAYLVEGDPEFWSYMEALRWAQRFAS
jgi:tRNA-splicing ligase RtcB